MEYQQTHKGATMQNEQTNETTTQTTTENVRPATPGEAFGQAVQNNPNPAGNVSATGIPANQIPNVAEQRQTTTETTTESKPKG